MVRPSMSTTRRWGFSSVNCSALSSLSSSSVTRVYSSAGRSAPRDGGGLGQAWQYGEDEQRGGDADQAASGGACLGRALAAGTIAFNHVCPRAVYAVRLASRPSPA